LGKSRLAIPIAIARGLRLSGSQGETLVSQPAPAVGRFESARQDAAFGQEQASDSYSHRPRLAPKRLTG
jgi:hypothetical protein